MNLECSSKGDKRFSAFYAKVWFEGKFDSIENIYQLSKRFGSFIPKSWRDSKGKKPTHYVINDRSYKLESLSAFYNLLWCNYLIKNPDLLFVIDKYDTFSDIFKGRNTVNCQAVTIGLIKEYGVYKIYHESLEIIKESLI